MSISYKEVKLTPHQKAMVDYQFIWNEVQEGLNYKISPEFYNECMEGIDSPLRITEAVDAKKFLVDVYNNRKEEED